MTWFHFTCRHSAESIDGTLLLRPYPQPMFGDLPITWLTFVRNPQPMWLGMDQKRQVKVTCNRLEAVFQVVPEDEHLIARWGDLKVDPRFAALLPAARKLDAAHGARPGLWGVTSHPLRVVRAP